jgi:hypothetical protein
VATAKHTCGGEWAEVARGRGAKGRRWQGKEVPRGGGCCSALPMRFGCKLLKQAQRGDAWRRCHSGMVPLPVLMTAIHPDCMGALDAYRVL